MKTIFTAFSGVNGFNKGGLFGTRVKSVTERKSFIADQFTRQKKIGLTCTYTARKKKVFFVHFIVRETKFGALRYAYS